MKDIDPIHIQITHTKRLIEFLQEVIDDLPAPKYASSSQLQQKQRLREFLAQTEESLEELKSQLPAANRQKQPPESERRPAF